MLMDRQTELDDATADLRGAHARCDLELELEEGHFVVTLHGRSLRVGQELELELERGEAWFRAWVVESGQSASPCIRIVDRRWPGAPLTVAVADLRLVPARRCLP